ncbi:MAG: hypothetical protein ACI9UA_002654 [Pseudoalteromonas tetraodonis]|jgi:hypothetical protein
MPKKRIHFNAATVECCEAIDWELVKVTFDTEAADFDEENRSSEFLLLRGTSGNLLWKWGAEKIPAGEAINAKLSGDSGRFSNEDSWDFIKLQPA